MLILRKFEIVFSLLTLFLRDSNPCVSSSHCPIEIPVRLLSAYGIASDIAHVRVRQRCALSQRRGGWLSPPERVPSGELKPNTLTCAAGWSLISPSHLVRYVHNARVRRPVAHYIETGQRVYSCIPLCLMMLSNIIHTSGVAECFDRHLNRSDNQRSYNTPLKIDAV